MRLLQKVFARRRMVSAALAMVCAALVGYALYTQHYQGLTPCPLCIFQRVGIAALGVAFLLAALPRDSQWLMRRAGALLVAVTALGTAAVATRHLQIQHLPEGSVPACGASLDYMLEVFSVTEVLRKVLTGSGECSKVDWTFLGLAMPAWVLALSLTLGAIGFAVNWPRRAR